MGFKQIYRKYILNQQNKAQKIRLCKQYVAEFYGVLFGSDKEIVKSVTLTKAEKAEVQDYWKQIYGKKIPLYWHRKYYALTGKLDKSYVPDYIYTTQIEPKNNPDRISRILNDKSLIQSLFARKLNELENVTIPKMYGGCANGFYYDEKYRPITYKTLVLRLSDAGEVILKPCIGESSGHGVQLLQLQNGIDLKSNRKIEQILEVYGKDFIIQERVRLAKEYADLHPDSCNTLRIMTYRLDNEIKVSPITLRIGRGGSHLDNGHAHGIFIGVSNDGYLQKYACDCQNNKYEMHPDTNVIFENYFVPYIPNVINSVKEFHTCIPNLGIINWDICINDRGQVVIIEDNLSCASPWLFQSAWGKGMFGEDLKYVVSQIVKK